MTDYKKFYANSDVISFFPGQWVWILGYRALAQYKKIGQDFDVACVKTMRANGHSVISGDIRTIAPESMLSATDLAVDEPFLVCGGPPCQPFSTAGTRLGINDPRGSLFMDFFRMIDFIRFRFFIMENVKGLISAPLRHIPLAERDCLEITKEEKPGTVLAFILEEFNRLGYKTVYGIFSCCELWCSTIP